MAIPSRPIGQDPQSQLLWNISKQMEQLIAQVGAVVRNTSGPTTTTTTTAPYTTTTTTTTVAPTPTTTTTTTVASTTTTTTAGPSYYSWSAYIGINNAAEACNQQYLSPVTFYTSVNSITNGRLAWADTALTVPFKNQYTNVNFLKVVGQSVSYQTFITISGTVLTNSTPC